MNENKTLSTWTLFVAGDFCSVNGCVNGSDIESLISEEIIDSIRNSDIAVVNLEGAIRSGDKTILKSGPIIEQDPSVPRILKAMGFAVATLANNHTMDYSWRGLSATIKACREAGLNICGAGATIEDAMRPIEILPDNGIRVKIFNFCEREFGIADSTTPGTAWISHPLALSQIRDAARDADIVIVIAHGGVEDVPFSPIQRQQQLRQFIDAGAAVVIGHHPHLPQGWERYGKGVIFHSLGNFLFDYYREKSYSEIDWGMAVRLSFAGTQLVKIEPILLESSDNGSIDSLGKKYSPEKCLKYLEQINRIISEPKEYKAYWQETAIYLWRRSYRQWFQYACNPEISFIQRLVSGVSLKDSNHSSGIRNSLALLNMIRNESHRWSIETALGVLGKDEEYLATEETKDIFKELVSWTNKN
jgi:poly-gamma-glutamate synthesis protein (capsule biosynthesis protein)